MKSWKTIQRPERNRLLLAFLLLLLICNPFSLRWAGKLFNGPAPAAPFPEPPVCEAGVSASACSPEPAAAGVLYANADYGFEFALPESWRNFTVVSAEWEGYHQGEAGQLPAARGPLISLRHPEWTKEDPRQDIPLMVFTLNQWDEIERDILHVGAAPIRPSELGRGSRYVFALPARYNYAFLAGYEEVETILAGRPLRAF